MRVPKAAAPFLVLMCTGSIAAQSDPQQTTPPATIPAPTETASIYITAATKKGMLIRDLKPEDISITEDKAPAKIENISCGKPEPLIVGILVDISGSRRSDSHLRAHYDALAAFLDQLLTGNDAAYVVAFNNQIYKLSNVTSDRAAISAAFDKLMNTSPYGPTALYDTIKATAGANFKGRSGRRTLVVVGDWEDNSSRIRLEDAVKAAQRTGTTIYAIVDADAGLESKKAHKHAIEAATEATKQTGGMVYDVEEKNDFATVFQAIGGAVVGACRVEYTTPGNPHAEKGAKLHVEATSKDVAILYPRVRFGASQ